MHVARRTFRAPSSIRIYGAIAVTATAVLIAGTTGPAAAQTLLSGPHNNTAIGDSITTPGNYEAVSGAQFDNDAIGLEFSVLPGAATLVVDSGTEFIGDTEGIDADAGTAVTINGGLFDGGNTGIDASAFVTINGGTFSNGNTGVEARAGAKITDGIFTGNTDNVDLGGDSVITGGQFSNGTNVFVESGTTEIFGGTYDSGVSFDFETVGGTIKLFGTFNESGSLTGIGTFSGTLADGGGPQTFRYGNFGGSIILSSAAPEPGSAVLAIGTAAFALLPALWRRRARTAQPRGERNPS